EDGIRDFHVTGVQTCALPILQALTQPAQVIEFVRRSGKLDDVIATRAEFLASYQNLAYAQAYRHFVEKARAAESPLGTTRLTEEIGRASCRERGGGAVGAVAV